MKIGKKGFFLAEVLIVSTILVVIITVLYIQVSNVFNAYNTRINYNQIDGLYALSNIRNYMEEQDNVESFKILLGSNDYIQFNCATHFSSDNTYCQALLATHGIDKLFFTKYNVEKLQTEIKNDTYIVFNRGEQEFITAITPINNNKYRLIASFQNGTFATLEVE